MNRQLPVLFVDERIAVVDKPAGRPTVPAPGGAPGQCVRAELERLLGTGVWAVQRLYERLLEGRVGHRRTNSPNLSYRSVPVINQTQSPDTSKSPSSQ